MGLTLNTCFGIFTQYSVGPTSIKSTRKTHQFHNYYYQKMGHHHQFAQELTDHRQNSHHVYSNMAHSHSHIDTYYMQAVPFFEAMALVTLSCSAASVLATTLDRVTRFHLEMNKTSMHQYNYINCELGHSVSTQPMAPRCPSPILPKKFLKLLWLE